MRKILSVMAGLAGAVLIGTGPSMAQPGGSTPLEFETTYDAGGNGLASREVLLPLGKAAIIELPRPATDIIVSDPDIVEAVIRTPQRVFLMGREAGQANAFFFDRANNQILNLEIRVEQDADTIRELMTKLVPNARISVESLNGNVIIHGTVDNASDAQRAGEIASRFAGEDNFVNMLKVREPSQVLLKIKIVEMQRRLVRQLGIDLNGVAQVDRSAIEFAVQNSFAISGQSLGGINANLSTPGFGDITNLDFAFDIFEQNGLVKTLAEPSIVALSGRNASFLAGGEFPVPEASANGTPSVTFKPFGVQLEFQPVVYSKNRIQLTLATEVSDVSNVNGLSIAGATQAEEDPDTGEIIEQTFEGFIVPGTVSRSAATTVELPSGGSLALAGLLQEDINEVIDGVPGLKETPVLGALFRSQEFQSQQTELVIIATPYLVEPTDLAALTDPAQGYAPPSPVQSVILGQLESAYGVRGRKARDAQLSGPIGFILD
ncbi:type II and III secretion system protein family protein [Parvularcula bermudensis]|nr:type II and III secretion system protein family protein [Parvularcula bermudensis]